AGVPRPLLRVGAVAGPQLHVGAVRGAGARDVDALAPVAGDLAGAGSAATATAGSGRLVVDGDVVHVHLAARGGRRGRCGTAADPVREAPAHGEVVEDEERVVDRVRPGRRVDLGGRDGEVVAAVQVPADLLRRDRAVDLDRVGVEARLAAAAGAGPRPDPVGLVAGPAGERSEEHTSELQS